MSNTVGDFKGFRANDNNRLTRRAVVIGLLVCSLTLSLVRPPETTVYAATRGAPAAREAGALQQLLRAGLRGEPSVAALSALPLAGLQTSSAPQSTLERPLVIARVQSAYTPSGLVDGRMTITYTVVNRLPLDELGEAEVVVRLAPGVTLVSGPAHLTLADGSLAFAVGEVGPMDGASVSIVVQTSGAVGQVDEGARATATFANQRLTAQTAPARLVGDGYAPFLGQQPEFMFNDIDLLEVAGLAQQDAAQAFALVRDATRWEAYRGSLRGARGTWWSKAGNALDRSSLLLGVLRTIGVPSRYVRGTLPPMRQRALIAQMYGDDVSQMGLVSEENRYDPYSDARLLGIANEHWWVEADLGSGWQALDANFEDATIGALYGAGGVVVTALGDADRHWTDFKLMVEQLPALTGPAGKLETFESFALRLPTAQIAGLPTVVGHFVRSTFDSGAVFYNIRHYYTPFIAVGGIRPEAAIYRGEEYFEQITNFPLASQRVTAAWYEVTISGPDVPAQSYRDEIVDRIGKLARRQGGTIDFAASGLSSTEPIVQDKHAVSLFVAPTWVPETAVARAAGRVQRQLARAQEVEAKVRRASEAGEDQDALLGELDGETALVTVEFSAFKGLIAMLLADQGTRQYAETGRVRAYYVAPRLLASALNYSLPDDLADITSTVKMRMNLMQRDVTLVPYPGQNPEAAYGVRMAHGIRAMSSEHFTGLMMAPQGTTVKSALMTMLVASERQIGSVVLTSENRTAVTQMAISNDAKARILEALDRGRVVIAPARAVTMPEEYTAWIEFDPNTGLVEDQDEYGGRAVIIERGFYEESWRAKKCDQHGKCKEGDARFAILGFIAGFVTRFMFMGASYLQVAVMAIPLLAVEAWEYLQGTYDKEVSLRRQRILKNAMYVFDLMAWLSFYLYLRIIREGIGYDCKGKHLLLLPRDGKTYTDDEADLYWSGFVYVGFKWFQGCAEYLGKVLGTYVFGTFDVIGRAHKGETADPAKAYVVNPIKEFLSSSFTTPWELGEHSLESFISYLIGLGLDPLFPGMVSYDFSGVKFRVLGFDHGASFAGALMWKAMAKDPDAPVEMSYNGALSTIPQAAVNQLITSSVSLDSTLNDALEVSHLRVMRSSHFTLTRPSNAVLLGGDLYARDARLLSASGEPLMAGDISIVLPSQGARLTGSGAVLHGSDVRSVSLWNAGGSLNGQAAIAGSQLVRLQGVGSLTLAVSSGAVVNASVYSQPVTIVFNAADWHDGERLSWLDAESVSWSGDTQQVQLGNVSGALTGINDAPAVTVRSWAGRMGATASASRIAVTMAGSADELLTAQPVWSGGNGRHELQTNVRANKVKTYTLIAQMDQTAGYDLDDNGTLVVTQKPDRLGEDTLYARLTLRDARGVALSLDSQHLAQPRASGLEVSVEPDTLFRHAWGDFPRYNVAGMLYHVNITYTAQVPAEFDLQVFGLPSGWAQLSQESVTLRRGQHLGIGLVISPSFESLPPPGTSIPFTVTVNQRGGGFSASGTSVWHAPETGLPNLLFDPNLRTEVAPTEAITASLFVFNGGAITDTFKLSVTSAASSAVVSAPSAVTVAPRGSEVVSPVVTFNGEAGESVVVAAIASAVLSGTVLVSATKMTHIRFALVPPEDIPLYEQAYDLRGPGCKAQLAYATYRLAQTLSFYRLGKVDMTEVEAARARLRNALPCFDQQGSFTGTVAVSTSLTLVPTATQPLVEALDGLTEEVERMLNYQAELRAQPALSAVRVNQPVTLPVTLAHTGRVSGTYTLVITDADGIVQTFTPFLAPSERFTRTVVFTPTAAGEYVIRAAAETPSPQVAPRALARVLAYERLTDILAVRGAPDFVETGSSASALSVDVVNHTPLPQPVTIALTMTAPGGGVHYTAQVTRTLMPGVTNVPMGTATFVNAQPGVYELRAVLVEEDRVALGGVSAGAGIRLETSSRPLVVPPGNVTATTWITTERTVYGSGSTLQVGQPISGGVDLTVTVDAALHSGTTPTTGVLISVPAGIYDIIYITGAVRWRDGGQWYGQLDVVDLGNRKYYLLGHALNTALGGGHPDVGSLSTMEAASAYHAGRFIRIRVTDTTTLAFYLYDTDLTGASANIGQIMARVVQVDNPDNTLRRRMETAMHHAAPRHALDAVQWDIWGQRNRWGDIVEGSTDAFLNPTNNQDCNGCHIQAQGFAGLAAMNTKLKPSPVDERMMEWLSLRLRRWQIDGGVNHGRVDGSSSYPLLRTSVAAWAWAEQLRAEIALGRSPNLDVVRALTSALTYLTVSTATAALRNGNLWGNDGAVNVWIGSNVYYPWVWRRVRLACSGDTSDFSPSTTYFVMAGLRVAYEVTGDESYLALLTDAASDLVARVKWRETCGNYSSSSSSHQYPPFNERRRRPPSQVAQVMLALQEAVGVITDTAKAQAVRQALATFEADLRMTQQITPGITANDGGWRDDIQSGSEYWVHPSDALVTALALYALARQGVRSTDVNLVRATEFLLSTQDWHHRNFTSTEWLVGRWHTFHGANFVAPTTWIDFAFPLIYETIGSYSLDVLHDTPAHAQVLTQTFNLPPQSVFTLPDGERRSWFYNQPDSMRYQVISYTSVLTGLRPGEVRALTLGTLVTYTIESGSNRIILPGSYVQAVKLIRLTPPVLTVGAGQTARFTVTLSNPLDSAATYEVMVTGLEDYGAEGSFSVTVPGDGQVERVMEFDVPVWASAREHAVRATLNGGQDEDHALLRVVRDVAIRLAPVQQTALAGETVTYSVVVSDLSGVGSVVDVHVALGDAPMAALSGGVAVPAGGSRVVTWTFNAPAQAGSYRLRAEARGGQTTPQAFANLDVVLPALRVRLGDAVAMPGALAVLSSVVMQDSPGVMPLLPGALVSVQPPAGWQVLQAPTHLPAGQMEGHGDVILAVPVGTPPGIYDVQMTAVMSAYPQVTAQATGRVTVLQRGVVVSVQPPSQTVAHGDTFEYAVLVTNTGVVADRFVVSPTGLLGQQAGFALDTGGAVIAARQVQLAPGQRARFLLTGQATNDIPAGTHAVPVQAVSVSDTRVRGVDYGWLTVRGRPELQLAITPTYQLIDRADARAWLKLSNAGTADAVPVQVIVQGEHGAAVHLTGGALGLLPRFETTQRADVWLPRPGRYVITAVASTPAGVAPVVATATVEYRMAAMMAVAGGETYPGQAATLPISVTNLSSQPMNNLAVRVSVPQGAWTLNGVSAEGGSVTQMIALSPAQPGENALSYAVQPLVPLPYGAERVTVTLELLLNGEVWQTETAYVKVNAPDLRGSALFVEGRQDFVHDVLTYTWRLRNTGDADALGAQAVVTLPADALFQFLEVLSVSSGSVVWDETGKRLTWQGDLPQGAEVVVVFRARASFGLPRGALASPFEVRHAWRPTYHSLATYDYPYRVYFMLVRKNAP